MFVATGWRRAVWEDGAPFFMPSLHEHQAIEPMTEAEEGVFPKHSRAGVTHDRAHLFAAILLIAMHGAFGARRLFSAESAAIQSQAGIIQQAFAFGT